MELALALEVDTENPTVGDLRLYRGNFVFTRVLADEFYQRLLVRFNFWRREWFMNLNAGTPWIEAIFDKAVPDRVVQSVLSQVVTGTVGCAALDSLVIERDNALRQLTVRVVARLEDGSTFRSTDYPDFIVKV